ncbi:MAG: sulfatase [Akkermansiaceae bacterium]
MLLFRSWLLLSFLSLSLWSAEKPLNVVFFLVDDLGQRDLGCYGSTFYETPNIDRLAMQGARFTDAYAACPVCSPTRASIMSGQWPQRTGVTDYIGAPFQPDQWKRNTKLLPAAYADRLPSGTATLASRLKAAGYATLFAGKWHLGPQGNWPENFGFDVNLGGHSGGGPYGGKGYFSPYNNPRLSDGLEGEHLADRLATETAKFIEQHKDQPFFTYFSFYDVHTPLMAREDLKNKYQEKRRKLGLEEKWGREAPRDVRLSQDHVVYAAMVEAMDQAVGKVIGKLDELKLREQTMIIFTSDNGGLSTSEGWPTSNTPLRGGKGWMYEGGIREPLIVLWPGVNQAGSVINNPVSSPDFMPTVIDAAKLQVQSDQPMDGISLRNALEKKPCAERALFWHYPHYGNQGGAPAAAIRRGNWKLIYWYEDETVELFDVVNDLSETINRASSEPERVKNMLTELQQWQKHVGAKLPQKNPQFKANKINGRDANRK